jgi:hypothetical protein
MEWYLAYVMIFFHEMCEFRKKHPEFKLSLNEKIAIVLVLSQMITLMEHQIQLQETLDWVKGFELSNGISDEKNSLLWSRGVVGYRSSD